MKLSKSLLLASVAGLAGIAGAQAADLPSKKAAPVEYVKVCPAYGAGFFYIPGTETCLKVGGNAFFYGYGTTTWRQQNDAVNTEGGLTISLDARNTTEYGLLRTFASYSFIRSSGSDDNSGSQPRRGNWFAGTSTGYGNLQSGTGMNAFVQLGGFTGGILNSVAAAGLPLMNNTIPAGSGGPVAQFSYTQSFGSGMSGTVAVEDAAAIREGVFGATANAIPNNVPDLVASFDLAQAWGSFKLAGVYHNVAPAGRDTTASSKTGYAISSGVTVKLDMLAPGDNIRVVGAYGQGAGGRVLGATATDTNVSNSSIGIGRANAGLYDAVQTGTSLTLAKTYSVGGTFQHYFAPTVSAYVGAAWGAWDYGSQKSMLSTSTVRNGGYGTTELGMIWSPVAGLEINPSIAYRFAKLKTADYTSANATNEGTAAQAKKSDDAFYGRLRVARSF